MKDEMVGLYNGPNGHEFEQTLGESEGSKARLAAVHVVINSWTQLSD